MATKRIPINRAARPRLTEELRIKATRLLQLNEDHYRAITDAREENQKFYIDGRHEEMCDLVNDVYFALGIQPHMDEDAMLREALGLPHAD